MIRNKKGAMEMSVGTIVTIVLLMSVLVLGLVMIRTIFKGANENINSIDQKVKDQINSLFSGDEETKLIIYPSRTIKIKKGTSDSGFGFSIRNIESESEGTFSYKIESDGNSCGMPDSTANNLIILRRTGSNIKIRGGDVMTNPILVVFDIPDTAIPCLVGYKITISKQGLSGAYEQTTMTLEITGK